RWFHYHPDRSQGVPDIGRPKAEVISRNSSDRLRKMLLAYSLGGSDIVRIPTRARYSSACNKSVPARSMILSRLSIDETSSSCSVRNHCRKLIVVWSFFFFARSTSALICLVTWTS